MTSSQPSAGHLVAFYPEFFGDSQPAVVADSTTLSSTHNNSRARHPAHHRWGAPFPHNYKTVSDGSSSSPFRLIQDFSNLTTESVSPSHSSSHPSASPSIAYYKQHNLNVSNVSNVHSLTPPISLLRSWSSAVSPSTASSSIPATSQMQVPNQQQQQPQSQGAHEQQESHSFSLQSPHLAQASRDIREAVPLDIVTPNAARSSAPEPAEPGADPASAPNAEMPSHAFGGHNRAATIALSTFTLPGEDVEQEPDNNRTVLPQVGGFDSSAGIGIDNNDRSFKQEDIIGPGDSSVHGLSRPASYPQLAAPATNSHVWQTPLQQQYLGALRSNDIFKAPVSPPTQRNPAATSSRSGGGGGGGGGGLGGAIRSRPPLLQSQSRQAPYQRTRHRQNSPSASASEVESFDAGALGGANTGAPYGTTFHPNPGPLNHGYFASGEPAYSHSTGDLHQPYPSNVEPTGSVYAYPGSSTFGHSHLYNGSDSSTQNYAYGSQVPQQARSSGDYDTSAGYQRRTSATFSGPLHERQQQMLAAVRPTHQNQTQSSGALPWTQQYQTTQSASGSQPRYSPFFQSHSDVQLPIPGSSQELFQSALYASDVNASMPPFQPQSIEAAARLSRRYSDQRNDPGSSPSFIRASQLAPGALSPSVGVAPLGHPFGVGMAGLPAQPPVAVLDLHTNLRELAHSWDDEEFALKRRLVQFYRSQEGNVIRVSAKPIKVVEYRSEIPTISCIYREDKNDCFLTSVDAISLLESLIGGRARFSIEEKNRIRRNLEGFRPITVSKNKRETADFFSLIMSFPEPKPRNIEKDVKVFPWSSLSEALKKIVTKYIVLPDGALNANELA